MLSEELKGEQKQLLQISPSWEILILLRGIARIGVVPK